jgi:hypothetical protein
MPKKGPLKERITLLVQKVTNSEIPFFFLFPGPTALPFKEVARASKGRQKTKGEPGTGDGTNEKEDAGGTVKTAGKGVKKEEEERGKEPDDEEEEDPEEEGGRREDEEDKDPEYVLLVIDGTWSQAKEIFSVIKTHFIPPAIQVREFFCGLLSLHELIPL